MCPGKKEKGGTLFLILFSLFSNKQDTMSGKQGPNRQMMNMQKLLEILVRSLITFLLFKYLMFYFYHDLKQDFIGTQYLYH